MKFQLLRKRLLTESAITFVALAVLGAITYFASTTLEERENIKRSMEGQVSAVTNETNGLREKFIRLQKDRELYLLVTGLNEADMLSNSPVIVDNKLRGYEYDYNLAKWSLDSGAASTETTDPRYVRKTSRIVIKPTTLTMDALSDIDVLALMHEMQKDFPGAVSFTGLRMTRSNRLTDEGLRNITKNGVLPLLNAEVRFNWYGITSLDPEEAKREEDQRQKKRRRRR